MQTGIRPICWQLVWAGGVQPLCMPKGSHSYNFRLAHCVYYLHTEHLVLHTYIHDIHCQGLCKTDSIGLCDNEDSLLGIPHYKLFCNNCIHTWSIYCNTKYLTEQNNNSSHLSLITPNYLSSLFVIDCSGAVFTHPIYFNNELHLMDFFTCYSIADRKAWGHNTMVSSASLQDVAIAQANVPKLQEANEFLDVTILD